MSAFFGLLLITLAAGLFGGALTVSRRPKPPSQPTESVAASMIAITTIALFATGLGLIIQFAVSYGREPLSPIVTVLTSAMLLVLLVAFVVIGRSLRRQKAVQTSIEEESRRQAQPSMGPVAGTELSRTHDGRGPETPSPPQAPSPRPTERVRTSRKRAARTTGGRASAPTARHVKASADRPGLLTSGARHEARR